MTHPFVFDCCGDQNFVALPFVGYTRAEEVGILAAVIAALVLVTFGVAKLVSKRLQVIVGSLFAVFIALAFQFIKSSDYVSFALASIDASVADRGSLMNGYEFYKSSLPSSEILDQLDVYTREWRRKPHVNVGVLSAKEADDLAEMILEERKRFYHIDHLAFPLPFFTHGPYWGYHTHDSSANKDTSKDRPEHDVKLSSTFTDYREAVKKDREFMMSKYSMLYERVRAALSESLGGGEVRHLEGVGVPGFHIIPSHVAWSLQVFRFHADERYEMFLEGEEGKAANFDAKGENCDSTSRISFTLPIRMPDGDSGLNYIDFGGGEGER
ncbi:hypothetical protein TL16_g04660 [Triparma laevis f. inornata]|uniref:Uncharacterized protein n=1 Tax=Triparma laevis f. inornata TaxID=1714386 RepID=A0A9W7A868_9STRA|nr:hypothetical protein TL16_g04660 [Triparma laevis f. inornata]